MSTAKATFLAVLSLALTLCLGIVIGRGPLAKEKTLGYSMSGDTFGTYNPGGITLSSGQNAGLQMDANGAVLTSCQ